MVGCVGKKTALLQILVVCRLVRFANVLVCALAVHFIVFLFLSLYSKLSTVSFFLHLAVTVSICKVGDCGLQTYQTVTILKRATTLEITTITPILYIHCCAFGFYIFVINSIVFKSNIRISLLSVLSYFPFEFES